MTIHWNLPSNFNTDFTAEAVANYTFVYQPNAGGYTAAPSLNTNMFGPGINLDVNAYIPPASKRQPIQFNTNPSGNTSYSNYSSNSNYKPLGGFIGNLTSIARSYIGFKESDNSYLRFTNGRREAWCADFVSYCARQAGNNSLNTSSVEGIRQWGIQRGKYHKTPQVGDAIILKNGMSHTGIVESITGNSITCIEGNASDQVKRVTYSLSDSRISGFVTLA